MAPRPDRGLAILLLVLLGGCDRDRPLPPPSPEAPRPLRIVAAGDVLMHEDVKRSGQAHGLPHLFQAVAPLFREADLGLANLETVIAPRTGGPGAPYVFNAPAELAPVLRQAGLTVLATANNHAYDQGARAMLETLEHLDAAGLKGVGSGPSREAAEAPVRLKLKGRRVSVFACTDLFNSNLNRRTEGPWVSACDPVHTPARVRQERSQADLVVVSIHWGNEYELKPSSRQRELARALVAAGADLVVGHHPHVLQPVERIRAGGREGVVAFSLGNFISNQDRMYRSGRQPVSAGDNRDGAALVVSFPKEGAPQVRVVPLWTENNWIARQSRSDLAPDIRVIPVAQALEGARRELEGLEATQAPPADLERVRDRIRLYLERGRRIHHVLGTPSGRAEPS